MTRRAQPAVLVTDAGYKHTLAAVRALSAAGYAVDALGQRGSLTESSRYLRRLIESPILSAPRPAEFLEWLARGRYAALLPIGARSVLATAQLRSAIEPIVPMAVHDVATISQCMDKTRLNERAAAVGLDVPRSWPLDGAADIQRVADEASFPLIIKRRHELGRAQVRYVADADALRGLHESLAIGGAGGVVRGLIAQQYIDGPGCALFALYDQGTMKRYFMHRRVREFPAAAGSSCCAESVHEPDLLDVGKRLLDSLAWHGVAMVEFKRARGTGRLHLMEVNPKFWGSLDLAIAAGVNFPVDTVRMARGEALEPQRDYAVGLRFHWPFGRGDLLHVLSRPRSAPAVLRDCLDWRVRSNLSLADPAPAWRAFCEDMRQLRKPLPRRAPRLRPEPVC